ncbi:MAG: membrane protein insertion efficiency factor YidD, partial [Ilumatobacteraceae bacterium]
MLRAIRWYQDQRTGALSPCRFFPSCSEYAHDAIERHGAWRGGLLAARRLGRCRPFGPSGFDPVPERIVGDVDSEDRGNGCCTHGT